MKKYTRTAVIAAFGVAAALSLAACDGSDSTNGTTGSTSSSTTSAADSSNASDGTGTGGTQTSGSSGTNADTAGDSTDESGDDVASCETENLAVVAEDAAPDATTGTIEITLTNHGSATCSVTGFAGVGITDADNTTNPISEGKAEPRITNIGPGKAAVFNISYVIDSSGNSLTQPTEIQVTPPNQTTYATVEWPETAGDIKGAYTDVEVYPTHTK